MRIALIIVLLCVAAGCNTRQPLGGVGTGATIGYFIGSLPGAGIGAILGAATVETHEEYYDKTPRCAELRGCVFQ